MLAICKIDLRMTNWRSVTSALPSTCQCTIRRCRGKAIWILHLAGLSPTYLQDIIVGPNFYLAMRIMEWKSIFGRPDAYLRNCLQLALKDQLKSHLVCVRSHTHYLEVNRTRTSYSWSSNNSVHQPKSSSWTWILWWISIRIGVSSSPKTLKLDLCREHLRKS